jgi:hypothetical protein
VISVAVGLRNILQSSVLFRFVMVKSKKLIVKLVYSSMVNFNLGLMALNSSSVS